MTTRCPFCGTAARVDASSRLAAHRTPRGFPCLLGTGADVAEVVDLRAAHDRVRVVTRAAAERARARRGG